MANNKTKNYGLDLAREIKEQDGTEWVFGATSKPCDFAVPLLEREESLPQGELQRGSEDFMDCVTRGFLNILETKFTYIYRRDLMKPENKVWLFNNGYTRYAKGKFEVSFSDRFIAMLSNTTRNGNSLKAPAHAIHQFGLIPKTMLPSNSDMTFDEYHNRDDITDEMRELGKEFLRRFDINYEQVWTDQLESLLQDDMVNIGGFAWPKPINGVYPNPERKPNHAFMAYGLPSTLIFDNYIDSYDGDWRKRLAPDYAFIKYGYRVYVIEQEIVQKALSFWDSLLAFLKKLFT